MFDRATARAALEEALEEPGGRIVPPNTDAVAAEQHLLARLCEPFEVSAKVMPPAFPFSKAGDSLLGFCIAHDEGYWLVYQPDERRFLCFWGESKHALGAHGVFGGPLYCWTA
jgi:hypothetical protein